MAASRSAIALVARSSRFMERPILSAMVSAAGIVGGLSRLVFDGA
jgi:hypothetical protein